MLRLTGVLVGIELVLHACIRAMELDERMQRGLIDEYHRHDTREKLLPNHFYPVKKS